MRAEDFNLSHLIDDAMSNGCQPVDNIDYMYPEMTYDDLTEDEKSYIDERVGECSDCGTPDYKGNLSWSDQPRGYLCDECYMHYHSKEDFDDVEDTD